MSQIKKAAIVCCSNGQSIKQKEKILQLQHTLSTIGIDTIQSDYIYADENGSCGTANQRAESLMRFYRNSEIDTIFDISGGDLANELLPLLDYEVIANSGKQFWGYSDLTTIINAIYAKTGKSSVLYQVRNLLYKDSEVQIQNFQSTVMQGTNALCDISYSFIQGDEMAGVVVGGNIRCLLKLAGTEYFPDMQDKILLLESYSGNVSRMRTYLSQLKQMGVFEKVNGILLGTFSEMEQNGYAPQMKELILDYASMDLPIACTKEIGHGTDSKAIIIGQILHLKKHLI